MLSKKSLKTQNYIKYIDGKKIQDGIGGPEDLTVQRSHRSKNIKVQYRVRLQS